MEEPHLEDMLVEEPRVPDASVGGGVAPLSPGDASLPPGQINHEHADEFDWDAVPEPIIDWDAIQIEERNEYEGNLEIVGDEQFYTLLGLKDEDAMAEEARQEAREAIRKTKANASADAFPNVEDIEGAAIPVDDCVPGEEIIIYDKNNPIMELGSRYPNMKEFRVAMRLYAINKEFSLKVDATDKKRYRGICKVPCCPWNIHARPERPVSGKKTIHKDSEKAKKMIRGPVTCPKCGEQGHRRNSSKCRYNAPKKRKRQPRKNTTKGWFPKEVSTSNAIVATNASENIVAATSEAVVLGEATSSQLPAMVTSTPTKQPTRKMVAKKITPKKLKKA